VMLTSRCPLPASRQDGHGQFARSQDAETPAGRRTGAVGTLSV
jgi:hypothetical protein